MEEETKKRFLLNVSFYAAWGALFYLIFRFAWGYLSPFVIGGILASAVQRPARWLAQKTKIAVGIWAVTLTVFGYLLLIGAAVLVIRRAVFGGQELLDTVSRSVDLWNEQIVTWIHRMDAGLNRFPDETADTVRQFLSGVRGQMLSHLGAFFSHWATDFAGRFPSFLLSSLVTLVAGCYFAKDYVLLTRFVGGLLKPKQKAAVKDVRTVLCDSILKLLRGYAAVAALTFSELLAGLFILRIRYAFWLALFITLVDVLPILGTGTVLLPWALFSWGTGAVGRGIGLLVLYAVITVVRNFAEPHLIGNRVGINPIFTLIAVFVGLRVGGVLGMVLLPIAFVTVIAYYRKQLEEEKPIGKPPCGA